MVKSEILTQKSPPQPEKDNLQSLRPHLSICGQTYQDVSLASEWTLLLTGDFAEMTRFVLLGFAMAVMTLKIPPVGLPCWHSGWESACQCRGHGFEPWSGKIPHAAEQLGPWATITEPAHLEPVLRNKRGRNNERPAHRDEEWPPLAATRESPRTETKTQHSHK